MPFEVRNLVKSYGGVPVLKGVTLDVRDGEIHALLGANGAGKSTLIKCLCGAETPDGGSLVIGSEEHAALTPRSAKKHGVAVIQQELTIAASLDVAENVFLGQELRFGPFVRKEAERREVAVWMRRLGVEIDPRASPATLGNAELQTVQIVRALRSDPKVLILDEPTAALSEAEADELGRHLLELKKRALPILYVTHRLAEVFAIADRVSVLRGGEIVLSGAVADLTHDQVIEAIVGSAVDRRRADGRDLARRPVVLGAEGLLAAGIGPLDLALRAGEILGVYGLVGSGRTELLETLFGANPIAAGRLSLDGRPFHPSGPADAVAAGLALVPADRMRKSIIGELSAADNLLLSFGRRFGRLGLRSPTREKDFFDKTTRRLGLRPLRSDLSARRFSGGNQQKLAIGRWINAVSTCKVLMLDEPTQGVDVGARSEIYDVLRELAAQNGTSILFTSSEPEELIQIADRVLILSGGRIAGIVTGDAITEANLITMAHQLEQERDAA